MVLEVNVREDGPCRGDALEHGVVDLLTNLALVAFEQLLVFVCDLGTRLGHFGPVERHHLPDVDASEHVPSS